MKLKRVGWVLAFVGGVVMALTLFGRKSVHTELLIEAPPGAVWSVLTDAAGYEDWNPVIVSVEGQYRDGARLTNHVRDASGKVTMMSSTVTKMADARELRQFGGVRGLLTFEHQWILHPVDGGTRVVQHEEYRGIGVWFWDASWVEPAYARANEALRQRVLQLAEQNGGGAAPEQD